MQARQAGFTLIEILVVLTIIGITIGFALLSFGDFGAHRRLASAAETFANQVKLVQHQAAIESTTYGIQIEPTRYYVLRFQPNTSWKRSTHALARDHFFPEHTQIHVDKNNPQQHPTIILYSTGDMTPFRLDLSLNKQPPISVIGLVDGSITVKNPKAP